MAKLKSHPFCLPHRFSSQPCTTKQITEENPKHIATRTKNVQMNSLMQKHVTPQNSDPQQSTPLDKNHAHTWNFTVGQKDCGCCCDRLSRKGGNRALVPSSSYLVLPPNALCSIPAAALVRTREGGRLRLLLFQKSLETCGTRCNQSSLTNSTTCAPDIKCPPRGPEHNLAWHTQTSSRCLQAICGTGNPQLAQRRRQHTRVCGL